MYIMAEQEWDDVLKLVSSDGCVFYVELRVAQKAKLIKDAMASGSLESATKEFKFEDIDGGTLESVIEYLHYNYKYQWLIDHGVVGSEAIPKFAIAPENALAVLVASIYLQC